jgi:hypothetical protein
VTKKPRWIGLLLLLSSMTGMSCQSASSREPLPISAGTLVGEFEKSRAATRSKYDGKEILVSGNALATPRIPQGRDDQGSVLLDEKDLNPQRRVVCWFSQGQSEQFSQVRAGQLITVKGVFNGEEGVELKFCKLVRIE